MSLTLECPIASCLAPLALSVKETSHARDAVVFNVSFADSAIEHLRDHVEDARQLGTDTGGAS